MDEVQQFNQPPPPSYNETVNCNLTNVDISPASIQQQTDATSYQVTQERLREPRRVLNLAGMKRLGCILYNIFIFVFIVVILIIASFFIKTN